MFVHGFSIEVCTNLAILEVDRCVQERNLFCWPGGSKFDSRVVTIQALNEVAKRLFSMDPDGKDVVYEPPPHSRFYILCLQELVFQLSPK